MFSRVNKITKKALCNYKKGRDYNTEELKKKNQTCRHVWYFKYRLTFSLLREIEKLYVQW